MPNVTDPVATLVFFLLVFTVVGVVFLFIHLVMGSVIRPNVPDPEKLTIYECGEPTVGSAWIQFDLRFYVVALLFVIFDVEVAFFFPWATVFGKANQLANIAELSANERKLLVKEEPELTETEKIWLAEIVEIEKKRSKLSGQLLPTGLSKQTKEKMRLATYEIDRKTNKETEVVLPIKPEAAATWARIAFFDILVFFGVLLVGFAYIWRRGDIDWVRAYGHHKEPAVPVEKPMEQEKVMV
jgi:NADH-quinone oxidoreductase subunit A